MTLPIPFFEKFHRALSLVFDVDPKIIEHIAKRDLLEFPDFEANSKVIQEIEPNSFQLLNYYGEVHDVIGNVIKYLFSDTNMRWNEPYDFTEEEKKLRKEFHARRKQKYASIREYFDYTSKKLFRVDPLYDEYGYILEKLYH